VLDNGQHLKRFMDENQNQQWMYRSDGGPSNEQSRTQHKEDMERKLKDIAIDKVMPREPVVKTSGKRASKSSSKEKGLKPRK
jgi:hypothetical protein